MCAIIYVPWIRKKKCNQITVSSHFNLRANFFTFLPHSIRCAHEPCLTHEFSCNETSINSSYKFTRKRERRKLNWLSFRLASVSPRADHQMRLLSNNLFKLRSLFVCGIWFYFERRASHMNYNDDGRLIIPFTFFDIRRGFFGKRKKHSQREEIF